MTLPIRRNLRATDAHRRDVVCSACPLSIAKKHWQVSLERPQRVENVASRALNQARSHNLLEQTVSQSASGHDRSTEKVRHHPALTKTRHLD
jgi:hypothetical protein